MTKGTDKTESHQGRCKKCLGVGMEFSTLAILGVKKACCHLRLKKIEVI